MFDRDEDASSESYLRDLTELVTEAIICDSMELIDGPHLVICRDVQAGTSTYAGPYATGLEALEAALHEHEAAGPLEQPAYRFEVAPLGRPCPVC
jgi:hypothetical protein